MPKNNELSSKDLEKRIDLLIGLKSKKGIIDSYVKEKGNGKKIKFFTEKKYLVWKEI